MQNTDHSGTLCAMSETPRDKSGSRAVKSAQSDGGPGDQSVVEVQQVDASGPQELGGPAGPEPTRYGDWERKGRCIDF